MTTVTYSEWATPDAADAGTHLLMQRLSRTDGGLMEHKSYSPMPPCEPEGYVGDEISGADIYRQSCYNKGVYPAKSI